MVGHQLGQVFLGGNVVIPRHDGDAQLAGDPAHGDRLQALAIRDPHGGSRDDRAVVPRPGPLSGLEPPTGPNPARNAQPTNRTRRAAQPPGPVVTP